MNILLTTTSFQDTPGKHHDLLDSLNFNVIKLRGPLSEKQMLDCIDDIDGIICGDDFITDKVISKGKKSKLKIISKYGIGLDKIDLNSAKRNKIPVFNCPGVNKFSVAEHVFALLLNYTKNINNQVELTKNESWIRYIGTELYNKNFSVIGFGNIGKLVAKIAKNFNMNVFVYDKFISDDTKMYNCVSLKEIYNLSDFISLHLPLDSTTKNIININSIKLMKRKPIIINTSRGDLVNENDISYAISNNYIKAYLADVLSTEPIIKNHPFSKHKNIMITPHVGSRTYESVERQAIMSINNLVNNI